MQTVTLTRLSELSFKGFELFSDVYQEVVIIKMLSNLHRTMCDKAGYEYQAHSFPKIYQTRVVHGEIPNYFLIRKYNESISKIKPVERFEDSLGVPREHLVIVMKFAGDSLWDRIQSHHREGITPEQLISVCYQVVLALAVSETIFQFEHRDLHVCNILIKPTKKKHTMFKFRSMQYQVKSFGVKACIIDATFSRMALGNSIYFIDLTSRLKGTITNQNPDGQEIVYQKMYHLIGDRWSEWFPETNIYWLKYFFEQILTCDVFSKNADQQQKDSLNGLVKKVDNFKMVSDFFVNVLHDNTNHRQQSQQAQITRTQATSVSDF